MISFVVLLMLLDQFFKKSFKFFRNMVGTVFDNNVGSKLFQKFVFSCFRIDFCFGLYFPKIKIPNPTLARYAKNILQLTN